jgi:hypothetical protein
MGTSTNALDEIPIGKGNNSMLPDEFPPEVKVSEDAAKPLPERLVSKTWATRKDAYIELGVICKKGGSDPIIEEQASKWHLYLADANPGALEQAMDTFILFLDKVKPATMEKY